MMAEKCKIKVIKECLDIYAKYRPEVGRVYDAQKGKPTRQKNKEFVILDILDKRIVLRKGEFEIVGC